PRPQPATAESVNRIGCADSLSKSAVIAAFSAVLPGSDSCNLFAAKRMRQSALQKAMTDVEDSGDVRVRSSVSRLDNLPIRAETRTTAPGFLKRWLTGGKVQALAVNVALDVIIV